MADDEDKPIALGDGGDDRVDRWDFPPTDESGDVDLEQLRYNLSLTPAERLAQNDRWMRFFNTLREGGKKYYEKQRQRER